MIKWWHNDSNIFLARPLYSDGEDNQCSWIQLVTSSRLWACALQLLSRLSIFLVIYDVAHCVLSKSRLPRKAELKKKKSKTKKLSNYRKSQAKYFGIGLMLVQVWCGKPPQKKKAAAVLPHRIWTRLLQFNVPKIIYITVTFQVNLWTFRVSFTAAQCK